MSSVAGAATKQARFFGDVPPSVMAESLLHNSLTWF
jgi:hypothetical protein